MGLTVLRQALVGNGYDVHYLGPQSPLDAFFEAEPYCNAVLLSNLDGHAQYYLRRFSALRAQHPRPSPRRLWYLGGQLGIRDEARCIREFRARGFDRVFPNYVSVEEILNVLRQDLASSLPVPRRSSRAPKPSPGPREPVVSDAKIADAEFLKRRADVLADWPTGRAASNLPDNARVLQERPALAAHQAQVRTGRRAMLVQPRCGVALPGLQDGMFRVLRRHGSDVLSFQIDSLTRNNQYGEVERVLRDLSGRAPVADISGSPLNGYPMVNHGVGPLRQIVLNAGVPIQTRHSTRDPRLLAEISFAGGVSSFEGGCISYNLPYYRDYPLRTALSTWQYVDRLTGLYFDRYGLLLDREFFGTLTGTLIPPSLAIATDVLEAVLAVEQGVRSVSLGYAEQGNRTQDIAACRALLQVATTVLANLGHRSVDVSIVFHQYMGAFPRDELRAAQLIRASATTAVLSGATRLLTKTPAEPFHVPTVKDNLEGLALVAAGIADARGSLLLAREREIQAETQMIQDEALCLIDGAVYAGGGSVALGIPRAIERGLIDIPFSPSIHNAGRVVTVRDAAGAVRYAVIGGLSLTPELRRANADLIAARADFTARHARPLYALIEEDALKIARGEYDAWPLDHRDWEL